MSGSCVAMAGCASGLQQDLRELDEGLTDGRAIVPGDLGGLRVGALADSHRHVGRRQSDDVGLGAMQVGLDDDSDVAALRAQPPRHLQGLLGVRR